MPVTKDHRCSDCNHVWEKFHMDKIEQVPCPECGSKNTKDIFSPPRAIKTSFRVEDYFKQEGLHMPGTPEYDQAAKQYTRDRVAKQRKEKMKRIEKQKEDGTYNGPDIKKIF